jgi:phage shock protein PspC (stress-responsive transcriptional regulator)
MYRNFTDRVLGGVCGGLATTLPLNAWTIRFIFILLTIVTFGVAALIYVALWWAMPQESLIHDQRGSFARTLVALGIVIIIGGVWVVERFDLYEPASGQSILAPVIVLILSTVFLLRQMTGAR